MASNIIFSIEQTSIRYVKTKYSCVMSINVSRLSFNKKVHKDVSLYNIYEKLVTHLSQQYHMPNLSISLQKRIQLQTRERERLEIMCLAQYVCADVQVQCDIHRHRRRCIHVFIVVVFVDAGVICMNWSILDIEIDTSCIAKVLHMNEPRGHDTPTSSHLSKVLISVITVRLSKKSTFQSHPSWFLPQVSQETSYTKCADPTSRLARLWSRLFALILLSIHGWSGSRFQTRSRHRSIDLESFQSGVKKVPAALLRLPLFAKTNDGFIPRYQFDLCSPFGAFVEADSEKLLPLLIWSSCWSF